MTVIVIPNHSISFLLLLSSTFTLTHQQQTLDCSLPSNFLCLETNIVLIWWLLTSTKFSNSCLLCWLSLSSISDVQQVYP